MFEKTKINEKEARVGAFFKKTFLLRNISHSDTHLPFISSVFSSPLFSSRKFRYITFSVTRWLNCLYNIWPFSKIEICPKASNFSQGRFKTLSDIKQTFKILPKTCTFLSKWRNFTKSGHADLHHSYSNIISDSTFEHTVHT